MKLQDNRPWIEGRPSKDEGGTSKVAGKPSGVDSEAGLVVPVGIQSLVPSPEILIRSEWINKTGVSTGEAGSMCLLPGRRIDPKPPETTFARKCRRDRVGYLLVLYEDLCAFRRQ